MPLYMPWMQLLLLRMQKYVVFIVFIQNMNMPPVWGIDFTPLSGLRYDLCCVGWGVRLHSLTHRRQFSRHCAS